MNKTKIGVIGAGKMGGAIIKGLIDSTVYSAQQITVSGGKSERTAQLAKVLGFQLVHSAAEVVAASQVILIAVVPKLVPTILKEISPLLSEDQIVVSVAGNPPLATFREILGKDKKIVRALPNTPVAVLAGMTSICFEAPVQEAELAEVFQLFQAIGKTEVISEDLMNTASALAGSSPAFVDVFIEAMADAAVFKGMPRDAAYRLASQAVMGSAKLAYASNQNPAILKDEVCVPGGTTIAGIRSLEKNGMRSAVIEAIIATVENH
ncbi:pyrroline-5-carboxylate reductase [Isobaculum melis]|uniref:Pyrroline-5-carboxylate reductase n=1 Tax=Isobaculum melis TaxID=142588 RepID=A0A1H9TWD8_9LACT|nr:pyrroline-5-carboxylate reductase [Isobaculum melis]SES01351.1 pyrroline-5-carboxylate reductase [Isobaculum melis]